MSAKKVMNRSWRIADSNTRCTDRNTERKFYSKVEVQGFWPPSAMSSFASRLDPYIPDKVITSRSGILQDESEFAPYWRCKIEKGIK
jgi:hypothetical protein